MIFNLLHILIPRLLAAESKAVLYYRHYGIRKDIPQCI